MRHTHTKKTFFTKKIVPKTRIHTHDQTSSLALDQHITRANGSKIIGKKKMRNHRDPKLHALTKRKDTSIIIGPCYFLYSNSTSKIFKENNEMLQQKKTTSFNKILIFLKFLTVANCLLLYEIVYLQHQNKFCHAYVSKWPMKKKTF